MTRSDAITCPKDSGITLFSGEAPAHPHIRAQGVAGWRGALAQPREPGPGASSWPPAGEPVDSGTRTEPGLLGRSGAGNRALRAPPLVVSPGHGAVMGAGAGPYSMAGGLVSSVAGDSFCGVKHAPPVPAAGAGVL